MGNTNSSLIRKPYDNYLMYHPDGTLMCFCSKKKANWYVKRGLAVLEKNKVKLLFTPNGYGEPQEILYGRENMCVISSITTNLTKHHVIPTQYRKHFRFEYKDKNSIDLVVLEREVHNEYELSANDLKKEFEKDYISNDILEKNYLLNEAYNKYNTIEKYIHLIPPQKAVHMMMRIDGICDMYSINKEELRYFKPDELYESINKIIVKSIGEEYLIVLWKLHFIKFGKPKHMPKWWKPNLIKIIKKSKEKNNTAELVEINMFEGKLLELIKKYNLYETALLYK